MNLWDVLILTGVALIAGFTWRSLKRRTAKGCSGCCAGCSHACGKANPSGS